MGEIMRWRSTRGAQRRIPRPESMAVLPELTHGERSKMVKSFTQKTPDEAKFTPPFPDLLNSSILYQNVANPVLAGLVSLDEWLAASENRPDVTALNAKVITLLRQYLPDSQPWKDCNNSIASFYYQILFSKARNPFISITYTDMLAKATRYLLVMALVDTLQQNPSPIQTPDQVYAALRWRTPILPDWVVQQLLAIRSGSVVMRRLGFSDLYITREEWDHYEPAEIASIENIMKGELKSRVHVLVNQTKVTTTTEEVTSSLSEQDSTTTDLSQLQKQSSSDIAIAAHIDGQVDTSGQYGPTHVNTHIGGSFDYSNDTATSNANTQSHESISRAVSKIEQTTRKVRTESTLTRSTDKEEHKFDNTQNNAQPVVGIYRWVDQIQNIELDRYPHRLLAEFEIPEPGAYSRWLLRKNENHNVVNKLPIPLTLNGNPVSSTNLPLQSKDIDDGNYSSLAARYMASGISPPPGPQAVAVNMGYPKSGDTNPTNQDNRYQSDKVTIPSGYQATKWSATLMWRTAGDTQQFPDLFSEIDVSVGDGGPVLCGWYGRGNNAVIIQNGPATSVVTTNRLVYDHGWAKIENCPVGHISQETIPVAVQMFNNAGFEVNVVVYCEPLDITKNQWKIDTYDLIVAAYNALLDAYNNEKAGMAVLQMSNIDANSPAQNTKTIKQELKRQVIEMLTGTQFSGLNSIRWDENWVNAPTTDLVNAARIAPMIQFLEQAFEWETMSYIFYPYYWADASRWPDLEVIEANDSNFADFLRSGSARLVLAARPGFEDQVNFYTRFGIPWGGGPMPAPGDPDYLSIADEIKAMQKRPLDVTVVDTWQVRLPTTLIWLQDSDDLPNNPSPTIDTNPNIVSLSTTSGAVGTTVTITGRNFRDIKGNSTVSFNGTAATTTRWSATLIDVTVPANATTGDVVITIKGVESNGVNFTVV